MEKYNLDKTVSRIVEKYMTSYKTDYYNYDRKYVINDNESGNKPFVIVMTDSCFYMLKKHKESDTFDFLGHTHSCINTCISHLEYYQYQSTEKNTTRFFTYNGKYLKKSNYQTALSFFKENCIIKEKP